MAPSASTRQKERRTSRMAKKALQKAQKRSKNGTDVVQVSVDDLIAAAQHAVEACSDEMKAIELYSAAIQIIQPKEPVSSEQPLNDDKVTNQLVDIMEKRADLYASIGSPDKALQDFHHALLLSQEVKCEGLDPAVMYERIASMYMNIGQLSEGMEALNSYKNGIEQWEKAVVIRLRALELTPTDETMITDTNEEVENEIQNESPEFLLKETKRKLAAAYCAVCELFMTDLCHDENAEQEVESFIQKALQLTGLDSGNSNEPCVDALQLAASHRLSQNRGSEAMGFILRAYEQMQVGCEALSSVVGIRDTDEDKDGQASVELMNLAEVQGLPSFDFRCQCAKILLECANISDGDQSCQVDQYGNSVSFQTQSYREAQKRCVNHAVDVLGSLLGENDEVVEVWNLLGDAFALLCSIDQQQTSKSSDTTPNTDLPVYYWQRACQMLEVVQKSLTSDQQEASSQDEDDDIQCQLDEVQCLLEEIKSKVEDFEGQSMEE